MMLHLLILPERGVVIDFIRDDDFYNISAVDVDNRHRIFLVDAGEKTVWVFDAEGTRLMNIGREGQGPGELEGPSDVAVFDDGRILVVDNQQRRLHLFSPEGVFDRTISITEQPVGQALLMSDETVLLTRSKGFFFRLGPVDEDAGRFGLYDLEGRRLGQIGALETHKNPLLAAILNGGTVERLGDGLVQALLGSNTLVFFEDGRERRVTYPIPFEPQEVREEVKTYKNDDGTESMNVSVAMDQICHAMAVRNEDELVLLRTIRSSDGEEVPNQLVLMKPTGEITRKWSTEFYGRDLALSPDGGYAYLINDLDMGRVLTRVALP